MRLRFILLFSITAPFFATAQKQLPEYGKVSIDELRLAACPFEKDAPAMKLFDEQQITLDQTGSGLPRITIERRVRIKIFTKAGFDFANIKIPYYNKNRFGKLKELSGIVYSLGPNGEVVQQELESNDFYKKTLENVVSTINFTFPNLKPGSIVEYRYKKTEKSTFQVDPWIIQSEIPTAYISMRLTAPGILKIKEKLFGLDTIPQTMQMLRQGNAYDRQRHFYYQENIPGFRREPFMTSATDNLKRMVFFIVPSQNVFLNILLLNQNMWPTVGTILLKSPVYGGQINVEIPETQTLIDSANKLLSVTTKINFLYESVKQQMVGREEQTALPENVIEAWKNRSGSSAEINLILLNLLRKAGIRAAPLLVSTHEHGIIAIDFPSLSQINGVDVVAFDSSKTYVLDAYLKYHSFKIPPYNILNRNAFLLDSAKMRWVSIVENGISAQENVAILGEIKNGVVQGSANVESGGYAKISAMDSTDLQNEEGGRKDVKPRGLTIISSESKGGNIDSLPLVKTVKFTYEPERTDSFYFINPYFLSVQAKNPFTATERNTDIDFNCMQSISFQLILKLPNDFNVESLPKSLQLRSSDTTMVFNRFTYADSTTITFRQYFSIKRSLFDKEEYDAVKTFFGKMYALMAEEIILKKVR